MTWSFAGMVMLFKILGSLFWLTLTTLRLLVWVKSQESKTQNMCHSEGEETEQDSNLSSVSNEEIYNEDMHLEIWRDWLQNEIQELRSSNAPEWKINIIRVRAALDLYRGLLCIRGAHWLYLHSRPRPKR